MIMPDEFFLPFGGRLNPNNRWAVMANLIPWSKLEDEYVQALNDLTQGNKAYSVRMALGALIIKERLGLSDRETVEQIKENPYLQYFIGLSSFQEEAPFHDSTMTHFRKRLDASIVNQVNEWIVEAQTKDNHDHNHDDDDSDDNHKGTDGSHDDKSDQGTDDTPPNQGKLMMDATCAPADIAYPTDLKLLNQAREKLEGMIDTLHEPLKGKQRKPRTYRRKARKDYLAVSKQKNPRRKKIRKAIGKQLNYVRRNLKHVSCLVQQVGLSSLDKRQYRELLVIQELNRQQRYMYENKKHQINDRIVSIYQPHVRPIVRGKTDANVEFGAKISVSMINGFATLDRLSWDAYHEAAHLQETVETYKRRYGVYPEAILADQIYRTRENRQYCKHRGIRLSGPKLGRPSKDKQENRLQKQIEYQDAVERNAMEGKFGEGKRSYGLGLISTRLQATSETVISIQFLVMNLEKILRDTFLRFLHLIIGNLFSDRNKNSLLLLDKI
jgi:hypothetical protein